MTMAGVPSIEMLKLQDEQTVRTNDMSALTLTNGQIGAVNVPRKVVMYHKLRSMQLLFGL